MVAHSPVPAYEQQDVVFLAAFDVLREGIRSHAFPAASVAITHRGRLVARRAFGSFTYSGDAPLVTPASLFDLASVSKVVATTSMAMKLYERGFLDLEVPVVAVMPEFAGDDFDPDPRRREISFHMLLAHSSGLPAHEKLFLKARNRRELLDAALRVPLASDPGSQAEYSDLGFIVLGAALERIADEPLDRFCQREIFGPLGMNRTTFNPPPSDKFLVAPTADDEGFRQRVIQGEVNDDNAYVLGGVAGHAGVFSTASDLASFAHSLLAQAPAWLRSETIELFTRKLSAPPGTSRALGWDTPSAPSQSGRCFSPRSFGHLGYTGTSLWIDPLRELSVSLLTNRTWTGSSARAIQQVRPEFHDAVVAALGGSHEGTRP
jgi:CubicO group peptidase (beta-lactamase class C family)